ncbi:hypothetical protein D3C87_1745770 [compost metagenome]
MIIVVDDTDNIPPKKMLSIVDHPIAFPATKPISSINTTSTIAVIDAEPPTLTSFLKLNSRPRLNNRKITPISAQIWILA